MLGGVLVAAVVIVVVAIAVSSSGSNKTVKPDSPQAKQAATTVASVLTGIPESGATLGNPKAKVTITEYGDLECPICQEFALSAEPQVIQNYVRTGKAKFVYRSLETASGGSPIANVFPTQQAAAYAAGAQNKAWYYILLFYNEQGQEDTGYVTESYLDGLAKQVPGLNYGAWLLDRKDSKFVQQVTTDEQAAQSAGFNSTPTVVVTGPKGQASPLVGDYPFSAYQSAINQVS